MVGVHTRHHNAMGDAAEPAREKTPKCRKREREEGEDSEVSDGPRVKREERSEAEESERVDGKSTVQLRGNKEDKRKAAKEYREEFRKESRRCVKAATVAREGTGRTFKAAVLPDLDGASASDSSYSYSYSPSVPSAPRGRSYASSRSGEHYEPPHWWSDQGRESSNEAVAREKKERGRVKDRGRGRSRSRGHAKIPDRSTAGLASY